MANQILYKTPKQIKGIRESGKYLTDMLHMLRDNTKPGVSLIEIEAIAQDFLNRYNLKGAFKGYGGFPANLCLSVNDCVVHGIPDDTILKDGDLLKIDAGVIYQKMVSDSAISIVVGGDDKNPVGASLYKATKKALDNSLQFIGPGESVNPFAYSVNKSVENDGYKIIKYLAGHGVGIDVHEGPFIYNWPHPDTKKTFFKPGMVIALEPITSEVSDDFREGKNGWNLYTKNGDLGAQREYTIAITDNGYEILSGIQ